MEKQRLTACDIAADMATVISHKRRIAFGWRMEFIVPSAFTIFIVSLSMTGFGLSIGHIILMWVFGLVIGYNLIMLFIQLLRTRKASKAIYRGLLRSDVSVTVEKFSHIAEDTIYEPYFAGRWFSFFKIIRVYYFSSGENWREPVCRSHYSWSLQCEVSSKGLENSSIAGEEFYVVTLNSDRSVKYIYNTKLFELAE